MKHVAPIYLLSAAFGIVLLTSTANGADCAGKAREIADKRNAEILSVSHLGDDKCSVTLRVPGKNGKPPRVVTKEYKG